MARLTIRIDLAQDAAFGPGKARLLELVDETGSIRRAAAAMSMSYRRAWLLLQEIESIMGAPVIATRTGGAKGGGASLTKCGRAILDRYRTIEERATRSVVAELRSLSRMASGAQRRAVQAVRPRSCELPKGDIVFDKPIARAGGLGGGAIGMPASPLRDDQD
jgi:molybdate transport system regulatory protein